MPEPRTLLARALSAALLTTGLVAAPALITAEPAVAAQDPVSCQSTALVNGGFEAPFVSDGSYALYAPSDVPGWETTDSAIEMWGNGFLGVPAAQGRQFVEINANIAGTLSQDVVTQPGETLRWSLKHRGREGTDVMRVVIGAVGGPLTQSGPNIVDGTGAWGTWSGTYTVPAGQTLTRFGFQAVSSAGGSPGIGNFLDDVAFGTRACLVAGKTVENVTRASGATEVGDVLRYTVSVRNDGGNAATDVVLADALDPALTFVPGSLRITTGSGAGALTDAAGDDRGEYRAATRDVRVRLGDAATAVAGGSLAVGAVTTLTFDARIGVGAAGAGVENEAVVSYTDTLGQLTRTATTQTVTTVVGQAADLSVTKTLESAAVYPGQPIEYAIVVANAGPHTATGVVLTDVVPAELTQVAITGDGADCAVDGNEVTCDLPDLPVDGEVELTVTGVVGSGVAAGTVITNTATASSDSTELDPADNTDSADATVLAAADLSISGTSSDTAPRRGDEVTFTFAIANAGPSTATGVVVTVPIPAMLTSPTTTTPGCVIDAGVLRCELDALAAGDDREVAFTATVDAAPGQALAVSAAVTSATADPDVVDNAIAVAPVVAAAPVETPEAGDGDGAGDGASEPGLAVTGLDAAPLMSLVGGLALGGLALLMVGRRRAARDSASSRG